MSYNREYKSSVFAMLYEDKKNILELYNGLYGESHANPEDIEINTLTDKDGVESGIFMKVKNDLSFIFDSYLNLYEHQSTVNRNIPLRLLLYVARVIYNMVSKRELYSTHMVEIPAPRFVVFYNGTEDVPARTELKLSDQYKVKDGNPDLELRVEIYNINSNKGADIIRASRTLGQYTDFVERTRVALEGRETDEEKRLAMGEVIDRCIADGILAEFLTERRDEVMMTSIFQYDQEAHEAALKEDGYDEGYQARHDELESEVANLTLTVSVQETTITDQKTTIVNQEATIVNQEATIVNQETTIANQKATITNQEAAISKLEKANQELQRRLKEYETNP